MSNGMGTGGPGHPFTYYPALVLSSQPDSRGQRKGTLLATCTPDDPGSADMPPRLPPYMKVEVKRDVPVVAKTVGDLRSLSTWPPGLILNFPRPGDRYPESVVEVERAS